MDIIKKYPYRGTLLAVTRTEYGITALIQKSYKGKEGEWKNSSYFDLDDLYTLRAHIGRAITLMERLEAQKPVSAPPPEMPPAPAMPTQSTLDDCPF